jgi:iron-sulfur cluster assembly protein
MGERPAFDIVELIKPVDHEPQEEIEPPGEIDESKNRAVEMTAAAAARIRELCVQMEKPNGALRLRITSGGCSGKEYQMDLVDGPTPMDKVITRDGATVLVDFRSLVFLLNCTLDFQVDMFGKQFVIENPNAKTTCSCGLSFTV